MNREPRVMVHTCNHTLARLRTEGYEFKTNLNYSQKNRKMEIGRDGEKEGRRERNQYIVKGFDPQKKIGVGLFVSHLPEMANTL